jgi:hypothetical protein
MKNLDRGQTQRFIIIGIICLAVLGLLLLAYIESSRLVSGPVIIVSSPENGISTTSLFVIISGTISNSASTTMNDRQIFIDSSGHFEEKATLATGLNRIKLFAEDRFGKSETIILDIERE